MKRGVWHENLNAISANQKKLLELNEINFQLCNAGLNAILAMLPRGRLLSPALTGNMQKGVIICQENQTV